MNIDTVFEKINKKLLIDKQSKQKYLDNVGSRLKTVAKYNAASQGGDKYWRDVANSINYTIINGKCIIYCTNPGARQRDTGGRINAKRKKYLTIPLDYAKKSNKEKVSDWFTDKIKTVKLKNNLYMGRMIDSGQVITRGANKGKVKQVFQPLFLLKKSVQQKGKKWWLRNNQVINVIDSEFKNNFNK